MADVSTKPSPIQRNQYDVAVELTQLHVEKYGVSNPNDIADAYAKYYALAFILHRDRGSQLVTLLPEEIKSKLKY
ncbi:hypothetical protein [Bacillus subtilis]|uniref:hypothetical protein n=1 Tax=Bacillus subtilis TaxID=1423 RepID=UPI000BA67D62|nr:hypothetical protein [Bacillus subtilis]PAM77698.1 hypothetical protein CFD21_12205 [Bacillus subtilis]CAF1719554.1 hypothetical protein NRS6094_00340 [Bacillus subtilis]